MPLDVAQTIAYETQALDFANAVARACSEDSENVSDPVWDTIVDEQGRMVGSKVDAALAAALENPTPTFAEEETIRALRVFSLTARNPFALSRAYTSF